MSDDQDGCERGMFLLVLANPGSPGPKAVKRLCACVCVHACTRVAVMQQTETDQQSHSTERDRDRYR